MKSNMKRTVCLVLTVLLTLSLIPTAAFAAGPTFSDVPANHWAYADVEAAATAGLMNGTGNGEFSPDLKVSVAQFLTLLGRLVFPDVKTEGADWFGPYVAAAQEKGLLTGTQVDVAKPEAEITRYDMAVILRAAAKRLGVAEKAAQGSEVKDYLDIPTRYGEAVLAVYGMGLIKGDGAGRFNGTNTMMRSEVATVVMRLARTPEAKTWAETWDVYNMPRTGEYVTVNFHGRINADVIGARVGLYYKDGRLLGETKTSVDTDSYGRTLWSMDVTMDKADYSETEKLYYAALIGQAKERVSEEMLETPEEYRTPQSIKETSFSSGFVIRVKVAESDQQAEQQMRLEGWMRYGTKGNPEKNGIGVENVPFQLRYTEDHGTTYTVIADGTTGRSIWYGDDTPGYFELTAQVEKSTFAKFWIGEGQLYISAETTVNGQRYVTQDRRTDGKATIVPIKQNWNHSFVELVPADRGETVDVPIYGHVRARTYIVDDDGLIRIKGYGSAGMVGESELTNSTVKIYFDPLQEGVAPVLIWETTADGGSFNETMTIDTAYYRTTGEYYMVEIEATLDGQFCTNGYKGPITASKLADRAGMLWQADSDEYYEASHRQ